MKTLLDEDSDASLVYAALELRCGVEARLKEYIEAINHIPRRRKKEWAIAKLGRSIETACRTDDKIMLFTIVFPEDEARLPLTYTPVPKRLQDIANRLGDYLHAPGIDTAEGDAWHSQLKALLQEGYSLFKLATSGELIGLPLMHRPTKRLSIRILLSNDDPRCALLPRLASGVPGIIRVDYIESTPGSPTFHEG
jgi:hypothetical protein